MRMQLLQRLNAVTPTRDTPRGLVVTIPDSSFENGAVRPAVYDTLARVASVARQPGLRVSVEAHSDVAESAALAERREEAVRSALISRGLDAGLVSGRNFGAERPLIANSSPGGRVANRRVEIVISGDAIGPRALWDRGYDVTLR
jgi:outer membrane protein OmpA-like peptidoglycan-associated protein